MATTPAENLLKALYGGQPIPGEECHRLLSPGAANALADVARAVSEARSQVASGTRVTFWITGRPGDGKTQSLRQLIYVLPQADRAGKYALAAIDLDKELDARRSGLVPAVVRKFVFAGIAVGGLAEARTAATQGQSADTENAESVAFGADVLASLSGVPPVALLASRGFRLLLKWVRVQGWYIRSRLRKRWPSNPQVVEFLGAWADYVLAPTRPGHVEFEDYLRRLASTDRLFSLFGYALQNSDYTTLVLACDEVTGDALKSLKMLWDPPVDPDRAVEHRLNLVFVLAAPDWVYQDAMSDAALKRRFCDPPCGRSQLPGPNFKTPDDFDHVVQKVDELLRDAVHLRKKSVPKADLDDLRDELSRSKRHVTWQELWREVIQRMANL